MCVMPDLSAAAVPAGSIATVHRTLLPSYTPSYTLTLPLTLPFTLTLP